MRYAVGIEPTRYPAKIPIMTINTLYLYYCGFEFISLRKLRKSEGESNWSKEADEPVSRQVNSATVGPPDCIGGLCDYDAELKRMIAF
jgi:hypothetical protein